MAARNGGPSREEILTDVRKVSLAMGNGNGTSKPCTLSQYKHLGLFDIKLVRKNLGCWNEVVLAAGLEPRPKKGGPRISV